MEYALVTNQGQIVQVGNGLPPDPLPVGLSLIEGKFNLNDYWDGEKANPIPSQPSFNHSYDWNTKEWVDVRTLEMVKQMAWGIIKEMRNKKESEGFPYMGKILDSDSLSVQRINTAVQAAQSAGEFFSIRWTCQDDSVLVLDQQGMLGVPVALAAYADDLHQIAKNLRNEIDSATTIAEVEAIAWP